MIESIYSTIISNIQKSLGKCSDWNIDLVIDHTISISKYNPLAGKSYEKLPKELDHPRKVLINIQNIDDNECFKWSIVRYFNPANHRPTRIAKADKEFAKKLDFKGINFPVKSKSHSQNQKKRILLTLMFLTKKIRKNIQSVYQKNAVKKNMLIYY